MADSKAFVLNRIKHLNVWRRGEERAPHKPLLILLSLARITRGCERLTPFGELQKPLSELLRHYGIPGRRVHPEYPFWWLRSDKIWEVPNAERLPRRSGDREPLKSELVKCGIQGGFTAPVYELLRNDNRFVVEVARILLDGHFPATLHEDILNEIDLPFPLAERYPRDANFRNNVLRAYQHCCAVCGYDLKIGQSDFALDAAHIKWHVAGGPGVVSNGLALCTIHHKALDYGALGLADDQTILISSELHGKTFINEWFLRFKGKPVRAPGRSEWAPDPDQIAWHAKWVFKNPAVE